MSEDYECTECGYALEYDGFFDEWKCTDCGSYYYNLDGPQDKIEDTE